MQFKSWHLALASLLFYLFSVSFSLLKSDPDVGAGELAAGIFLVAGEDCFYLLALLLSMLLLETGKWPKVGAALAILSGFVLTMALLYSLTYYPKTFPVDSGAFLLSSLSLTSAGIIFFLVENKKAGGEKKLADHNPVL